MIGGKIDWSSFEMPSQCQCCGRKARASWVARPLGNSYRVCRVEVLVPPGYPGSGPRPEAVGLTELGGVAGSSRGRRWRQRVRAAERFHLGTGEAQWWGRRPSHPETGVALRRGRRPSPRPWWLSSESLSGAVPASGAPGMLAVCDGLTGQTACAQTEDVRTEQHGWAQDGATPRQLSESNLRGFPRG